MYTKGDFHIHSTYSDGDYSPTEIIIMAKENGINILSLTDHNNVNGIDEATKAGDFYGVRVIPGVEISCRYNGKKVHVLGYFPTNIYSNPLFTTSLYGLKKGDFDTVNLLLTPKTPFVADKVKNKLSVLSAINFISIFNGISVLAHPIKLPIGILHELLSLNFSGLEGKYFKNSQDDTNYFLNICTTKNWIYTAGSDFHTDKRDDPRHGTLGKIYLNNDEITSFLNYLNQKKS